MACVLQGPGTSGVEKEQNSDDDSDASDDARSNTFDNGESAGRSSSIALQERKYLSARGAPRGGRGGVQCSPRCAQVGGWGAV